MYMGVLKVGPSPLLTPFICLEGLPRAVNPMHDTIQRIDEALADGFEVDEITSDPTTGVEVRLRKDDLVLTVTIPPREARALVYGTAQPLATQL